MKGYCKTTETEQSSSKVRKTQTWETWIEDEHPTTSKFAPPQQGQEFIKHDQTKGFLWRKQIGFQTPKMEIWNDYWCDPSIPQLGAPPDDGWRRWRSDRGDLCETGAASWDRFDQLGVVQSEKKTVGHLECYGDDGFTISKGHWRMVLVLQHANLQLLVNQAESSFTSVFCEIREISPTKTVVQQHHFASPPQTEIADFKRVKCGVSPFFTH